MWACSLVAADGGKSRVSFRLDWISVEGCVLMPDHKHDIERMPRGASALLPVFGPECFRSYAPG
jgi:hypothetical protein